MNSASLTYVRTASGRIHKVAIVEDRVLITPIRLAADRGSRTPAYCHPSRPRDGRYGLCPKCRGWVRHVRRRMAVGRLTEDEVRQQVRSRLEAAA